MSRIPPRRKDEKPPTKLKGARKESPTRPCGREATPDRGEKGHRDRPSRVRKKGYGKEL